MPVSDDTPMRTFGDGFTMGWEHAVGRLRLEIVASLIKYGWDPKLANILFDRALMHAERARPIK